MGVAGDSQLYVRDGAPVSAKILSESPMELLSKILYRFRGEAFTGLGAKPQDMTALSIDYVITLTGGAPSGGRWHNNVNTTEKLCIIFLFFLFLLKKPKDITTFSYDSMTTPTGGTPVLLHETVIQIL